MATYNGHRSWNAWNVALWINNTEWLYNYARDSVTTYGPKRAARIMLRNSLEGSRTPDGAKYNYTCIFEAITDILD